MRVVFHLLIWALVVGCVSYEDYEKIVANGLQSWKGFHKDDLIKTWGAPQATVPLQDGEMHTYGFSEIVSQQDSKAVKSIAQLSCRYSFQTNKQGQIVDAKASGNAGGCAKFIKYNPTQTPSSLASPVLKEPELVPIAGKKPKKPKGAWTLKQNVCLDGKPTAKGQLALDQMNQKNANLIKFLIDFDKRTYSVTVDKCIQKGPFKLSAKDGRIKLTSLPGGTGENCPPPLAGDERILENRGDSVYAYLPPDKQVCETGYLAQEFVKAP